jgi:hypothetical protein
VKTDLWRAANVALCVMDLFFRVSRDAKPPLTFVPDFEQRLMSLADQHSSLREEMMATERFQRAQRIANESADKAPS